MTGWLPAEPEAVFGAGAVAREAYDLLTVDVPAESWVSALRAARADLGCTFFDWLSAVDEPGTGFQVCAHLVALGERPGAPRRLLVRTTVPHEAAVLPTATGVFPGAAWHERETHEMFGVDFTGHPGLAPLLLPEEFEGHPLRKDFVLAARVVKAWPGAKEPGESHDGGPKRRQMLPPGVPDPNEWGPLKGQLPPAPTRPARTPRAGAGGAGGAAGAAGASGAQGGGRASGASGAATPSGDRPPRRMRGASGGSVSQGTPAAPRRTPDAPWERPTRAEPQAEPRVEAEPPTRPEPAAEPEPPTEPPVQEEPPAQAESPAEPEPPAEPPAPRESEGGDPA